MNHEINKILYATDLSPISVYVFRYALSMAKKHNAKIVILHVFELMTPTLQAQVAFHLGMQKLMDIQKEEKAEIIDRIKKRLEIYSQKELKDDPDLEKQIDAIEVCEGFPAEEILNQTERFGCDVIVLGTHGKGFTRHTFLGSVAKKVLRRTRKPVFVVPLPKEKVESIFQDI